MEKTADRPVRRGPSGRGGGARAVSEAFFRAGGGYQRRKASVGLPPAGQLAELGRAEIR